MANFMCIIWVFFTAFICADALMCVTGNMHKCTAHNVTYADKCSKLEARNQVFTVQKCLQSQSKCLLIGSKLSFENNFDLDVVIAACGTGTLEGCNDREELIAINPNFGQIGKQGGITTQWNDDFSGPGYEYDTLDACTCDTDECVSEDQLSEYGMAIFGQSITIADQLQCIVGNTFNCTAYDPTYIGYCQQIEGRNKAFVEQRCSEGQDKCLLFASKLSFEDKFDLQFIIATCGTGALQGCKNRQELIAINPTLGKIGQGLTTPFGDDFSGTGYKYDSLDVCACSTDFCIDEDKLSQFEEIVFGNNASCLACHFLIIHVLIIVGTFLVHLL